MTKYIINYLSTLQELTHILQELDEDLNNFVSVVMAEIKDDSAICSLSTWTIPNLLNCHLMERKGLEPIYIDYRYDKYIQIYKNLIYLYCGIPHEMPSCFTVSNFAVATLV